MNSRLPKKGLVPLKRSTSKLPGKWGNPMNKWVVTVSDGMITIRSQPTSGHSGRDLWGLWDLWVSGLGLAVAGDGL